jgi:cytochrome c oxidase assembly protein subunit 15
MILPRRTKAAIHALFAMVCIQACLGIATLLSIVWLPLAVMHQAGAAMTFCLALWCLKELRGGKDVPTAAHRL